MSDYNLYINYIIRRNNYFKQLNKVYDLETELSSLRSLIQSSKNKEIIVDHNTANNDISNLIVKEQELISSIITNKNTLSEIQFPFENSKHEVERLKEKYFNDDRIYKERSMFYLFYYLDFKKNYRTTDFISERIGITREHLQRLKKEYRKNVSDVVYKIELKKKDILQLSQ